MVTREQVNNLFFLELAKFGFIGTYEKVKVIVEDKKGMLYPHVIFAYQVGVNNVPIIRTKYGRTIYDQMRLYINKSPEENMPLAEDLVAHNCSIIDDVCFHVLSNNSDKKLVFYMLCRNDYCDGRGIGKHRLIYYKNEDIFDIVTHCWGRVSHESGWFQQKLQESFEKERLARQYNDDTLN